MKKSTRFLALLLAALLLVGAKPVPTAFAVDDLGSLPPVSEEAGEGTPLPEESPAPSSEDDEVISDTGEAELLTASEESESEEDAIYEPEVVENQTYILEHANREYTGDGDTLLPMDFLYVAYTLVDGSAFDHAPTLDELWTTNEDGDHVADYWESALGQFESCRAYHGKSAQKFLIYG